MTRTGYHLHGLRIDSEIPLPGRESSQGTADVLVEWDRSTEVLAPDPTAQVLAEPSSLEPWYTVVQERERIILSFHEVGYFLITPDFGRIQARAVPVDAAAFIPVLLSGTVLATLLSLRGATVLHASGVQLGGLTAAIVGASGSGKSTVSALLCAAGGRLVSDDVLRISDLEGRIVCHAGTTEIRLRPTANELLHRLGAATETADGRMAVCPRRILSLTRPLDAIVIPQPDRATRKLVVERLPAPEALAWLIRFPRVLGWQVQEPLRREFSALADLVTRVPVFRADIPWGPPFDPELGTQLAAAVRDAVIRQ